MEKRSWMHEFTGKMTRVLLGVIALAVALLVPVGFAHAESVSCADAYVASGSVSVSDVTWSKTVYVPETATLSVSGESTVNGDVYVKGTFETSGVVKVNGTIHCLNYEGKGFRMSAGGYAYGILRNSGRLNVASLDVTAGWLSTPFPTVYHGKANIDVRNAVEPTCTEAGGYTSVATCSICGEVFSEEAVVTESLGHEFSNGQVIEEPSCAVPGCEWYTCARCGEIVSEEIPALGHVKSEAMRENDMEATCEKVGSYDSVVKCTRCGEELSRTAVVVNALGHAWGPWTTMEAATTTSQGRVERVCSRCGAVESQTSPTLAKTKQTIKVGKATKTYKGAKLVKLGKLAKTRKFNLSASAKGAVSYAKISGTTKVLVSKSGKVTVKKGLKAGTYKVKVEVRVAETAEYLATTKKATITVKVA